MTKNNLICGLTGSPKEKIAEYLNFERTHYPLYYREIYNLARLAGKVPRHVKLVVCVLVHSSERDVSKALGFYSKQIVDKNSFELFIFLNRGKNDPPIGRIERELIKFKKDHKELTIKYVKKTFGKKITFGYLRKIQHDTLLLRSTNPNLIHLVNDIDIEVMSPDYIKKFVKAFNKHVLRVAYCLSGPPIWINKFPIFGKLMEIYRAVDIAGNEIKERAIPVRFYENFAFTSYLYVLNGGFLPRLEIAEDLTFSYSASQRFGKKIFKRIDSVYVSSVRRPAISFVKGIPIFGAWEDFWESDIRKLGQGEIEKKIRLKEKRLQPDYLPNEIELLFNHLFRHRILKFLINEYPKMSNTELAKRALNICGEIMTRALNRVQLKFSVTGITDGRIKTSVHS